MASGDLPASLVDIGANLTHESFERDRAAVLLRAREAGVGAVVLTGTTLAESQRASALVARHETIAGSTAGIHPHCATELDDPTLEALAALHARPEVLAVGECGLDYNRDFSPRDAQRDAFTRQLELAERAQLPLFLHQRDAHEDFLAILDPWRDRVAEVVVHCFTGTGDELRTYVERDFYVGITGWICDERRGMGLREIVGQIPDDRLMIETDAPFLLPRTIRPRPKSRRNEPANLVHVLDMVAQCRVQPREHVAEVTAANARRFFRLEAT
jgi:TatD DNase family protein